MELNEYQDKAMETCMPSCRNIVYMTYNLVGEVGEFYGKIGKAVRKRQMEIGYDSEDFVNELHYVDIEECLKLEPELRKEAGDILWQLSGLCSVMGWTLEDVAAENLEKLASRKIRGVIDGNGDNR